MTNPRCPVCGKFMERVSHPDGTVDTYECCGVTTHRTVSGFHRIEVQDK